MSLRKTKFVSFLKHGREWGFRNERKRVKCINNITRKRIKGEERNHLLVSGGHLPECVRACVCVMSVRTAVGLFGLSPILFRTHAGSATAGLKF